MESRFVLDTHVWISIFHTQRTEKLIDALIDLDITIVSCDEQCKELLDVLHRPILSKIVTRPPDDYIAMVDAVSEIYESRKRFTLLMDYKDNYLVDLAWQSKSALVSDDKHFLPLKRMLSPKVQLYTKSSFYRILGW